MPRLPATGAAPYRLTWAAMAYFLQQLINGLTLGRHLRPDRHRLHDGLRHHRHDQLRPWRHLHGRRLPLPDRLLVLRRARHHLGAAGAGCSCCSRRWRFTAVYGWTVERIAYRPLRGSFRLAPLISAIGMSIVLQNFVQVTPGRARQAAAAGDPRRLPADGERRLRRAAQLAADLIMRRRPLVLMAGFTWLVTRDAAGPRQRACEQDLKMAACSASTPTAPSASPSSSAPRSPPSPG